MGVSLDFSEFILRDHATMPRCLRRGWIASNVIHIFKVAKTVTIFSLFESCDL